MSPTTTAPAARLVEYFDGLYWKVRDPIVPAEPISPAELFVWHRGEGPLFDVFGGENSKIHFTTVRDRIPLERVGNLREQPFLISTIHGLQITLFPMIILAWTIERMSLIWEEEGPRNAIMEVGGSVLVAVVAFLFMRLRQVQYWAFNFPELLLVLLAAILLLGRYTGYRLTEHVKRYYSSTRI